MFSKHSRAAFLVLADLLALVLALGCQATDTAPARVVPADYPTTAISIPLAHAKAREISVEQLELVLPRHPVVAGFDVDDTLIFSAPAFNALQPQYDADVIRPKDYELLTAEQKAKYHEFWNKLNEEYDDRSIPKQIGKRLLDLHIARGDTIYVISKRQSTVPDTDTCTERYERMFGIKLVNPVIQTQLKDKTPFLCRNRIEYYYGDADTDITAAVTAGAVPIRVKRAADSYSTDAVHNGQLGEIVLENSER